MPPARLYPLTLPDARAMLAPTGGGGVVTVGMGRQHGLLLLVAVLILGSSGCLAPATPSPASTPTPPPAITPLQHDPILPSPSPSPTPSPVEQPASLQSDSLALVPLEPSPSPTAQTTPAPRPPATPTPAARRRLFAYYVPYDGTAWRSLAAYADQIDYLGVQWVTVDACGRLSSQDDQTLLAFARARGLAVLPSLLTLSGSLNHRLLTDPAVANRLIDEIVAYVTAEDYAGFDLDLEGIEPGDRPAYSAFVARLGAALRARGKLLTLAVPAKTADVTTGWAGAYDYAALGPHADLMTLMTYDYRGPWSGPGSIAPYDWVERVVRFAASQLPAQKILIGLAFYGYDWNLTTGQTRSLHYRQATALAERYGVALTFDPLARSVTFRYRAQPTDPPPPQTSLPPPAHVIRRRTAPPCPVVVPSPTPSPPRPPRPTPTPAPFHDHVVWLEDSASAAARLGLADRYGTAGVAAWRLGQEDPRVWEVFRRWREAP